MENEYNTTLENYDSDYLSEEYTEDFVTEEHVNDYVHPPTEDIGISASQPQVIQQPVYIQPHQVVAQPIYTQPVIAQPIYTQPILMQAPIQPIYPPHNTRNYYPMDELKAARWHAHPVLVFFALILCFPVGLVLLLFFTKWGVFPKIFVSLFSLLCIFAAYEVLAFYSIFDLPSLLNNML